jgi:hypothetical protein
VGVDEFRIHYAKHVAVLATGKPHHTVLWNFFPYLTEKEWLKEVANAADEAKRVFETGYVDTLAVFAELVRGLDPALIVFHGVSSAVPILGRIAIRQVRRRALLVPNLSRGLAHTSKHSWIE